jgi:hypothetical protein
MATALISLLAAFVAGLLTLGTAVLTQRRADRREDARWNREREREQTLWAREDAARSYEHRRAAYADFIKGFHRQWKALADATNEESGGRADYQAPPDYLDALRGNLFDIQIFGTENAAKLAGRAFLVLHNQVAHGEASPYSVLAPLMQQVRRDLSIPDRADDLGSGSQ